MYRQLSIKNSFKLGKKGYIENISIVVTQRNYVWDS